MKAGIGARITQRISPPEVRSQGWDRMLAIAQLLQLAVGAVALVAVWVLPPARPREQVLVTALLVGIYLPWSLLSRRTAVLSDGAVARVVHLAIDLGAVGLFALAIPSTRIAVMFTYGLVVAFHAYVSGRTAGLAMGGGSILLVGLAEWRAPVATRLDAFTLVMYAAVTVAMALMVDALATERRRTARHMARLHRAVESLDLDPTLEATTDSIAEAAKQAVNATAVMVLLPRDDLSDALQIAGGAGLPDDLRTLLRNALLNPGRSPSGLAMREGRPVSVPDLAADERFAWTAPTLARYDARSMVALPLGPPSNPIGVLNAYFSTAAAFDEDDLHLLSAYARQASITVARALAFDQERRAAAQLAQADELKSDFVSTVSHELRTPLTSISGFIDTVLLQWDRLDEASKKDLLQRSAWNARELRRLIEQVLAFSALEAPDAVVERRPYALRRGVEELVHHMAPALRTCEVTVDVDDDLVVLASKEAMHQVLGNLLTNASKYSPAGSRIHVHGWRDGSYARVAVSDEGPGVPEADRARIFDRFFRGATTRSTRGTGIGLAIVRSSVESLGGTVDLRDSEPGAGATFEVTLPLADASAEASVLLL
jgi:signal transduction histidine kinase